MINESAPDQKATFPIQKILFGPPGSGKSFRTREIAKELRANGPTLIEVTFHPEYDYGDFVAKLLPMTVRRKRSFKISGDRKRSFKVSGAEPNWTIEGNDGESTIEYAVYPGPLIKAVAKAVENPAQNVLLVIDEINRGNCSAIFGDIFQLLDRDDEGWSTYAVDMSDVTFAAFLMDVGYQMSEPNTLECVRRDDRSVLLEMEHENSIALFEQRKLRLPPNLAILATMNTSDESVYYMDTAFKRRWDFEYLPWNYVPPNANIATVQQKNALLTVKDSNGNNIRWEDFLTKLNDFIATKSPDQRIDDKQIGLWFIRATLSSNLSERIKKLEKYLQYVGYPTKGDEHEKAAETVYGVVNSKFEKNDRGYVCLRNLGRAIVSISGLEEEGASTYEKNLAIELNKIDKIEGKNGLETFLKEHNLWLPWKCFLANPRQSWPFLGPVPDLLKIPTCSRQDLDESGSIADNFYFAVIQFFLVSRRPIEIPSQAISNKLMHFLWDNVFSRDRRPLEDCLNLKDEKLRSFGDFSNRTEEFVRAIMQPTKI